MSVNGTQNLTASGGAGPYTWELVGGGGALSGSSGNSVAYTAPASNPGCGMNPFIRVTDSCGNSTTVNLAVNGDPYGGDAYWVMERQKCETPLGGDPPVLCNVYGLISTYKCDGSQGSLTNCGVGVQCSWNVTCDWCFANKNVAGCGYGNTIDYGVSVSPRDVRMQSQKDSGCCPATTTTCLHISRLATDLSAMNLATGQGATFTGLINNNSGGNTSWTVSVAGRTITGAGSEISAVWDGRDASGKQVQPGTYTATVTARTDGGACSDSDSRSIDLSVTSTPEQCLRQDIGSTVNVANGNLHHSQTLFRMPYAKYMGEFVLSYESFSAETEPLGRGWTHTFNIRLKQNNDNSYTVVEGDGKRIVLYPGGAQYKPQMASYPALTPNADGTFTLEYKNGITYRFNQNRFITGISDRNSNTVSFTYDAGGNLTGIVDTSGRSIVLAYDPYKRISRITDPNSNVHTFHYTGEHFTGLSSQIVHLGVATWSYTYDAGGFLSTKTDPNSFTTAYSYGSDQRLSQVTDPEGRVRAVAYYPQQSLSRITEKDGGVWTYQYDAANGTLTERIDPLGNKTTYAYDPIQKWNLKTVTDPRNSRTTYTYDANNNITSVKDALSNVTSYAYNALNLVTGVSSPGDAVVSLVYDAMGNLTSLTDPMNNTTRYTYDARGNRLTEVDASSRTTSFTYDVHNYLLTVTDPAGVTTLTYDAAGNVARYKDPENHVTRFSYNGLNKITKVTEPRQNVTTSAYDAAGNIQSVTDANGKTTQYAHNYNGRVTRITDALGNRTDFTYGTGCQPCGTGVDQLTSLTDPRGNTTVFEYDLAGRLAGEYNPLGHFKTYTYDAAGNVASMTSENNVTTRYQYDPLNRMTQATYPDGTTKAFSYSARGKMTAAANAYLGYAFTYDNNDRIIAVTRSDGRNVSYQYNAVNGRSSMTSPDGRMIGYSYDTANRLNQITSDAGVFVFTHDAAGRRTGLAHPNGVSTAYNYDASGYLTKILARSGKKNTIDSFVYAYDNAGNRTSLTDLAGLHSYTYDDTYQLTIAGHPGTSTELYSYDPAGNRSNTAADPDNALAEDVDYTYSHDYNGNLVQKVSKSSGAITTYSYDYENRLVRVDFPGTAVAYKYDALGRRIEKNVNGAITQYVYDGANIVTEYDGSGNVKAAYTHNLAVDDPLAVRQGNTTYYYHKDGLGSVTDLTDAWGKVVKRYNYRGFGEIYSESGTLVQPYIFTGRESDPETGLYYYRARYYDPKAGRFITKDPIGFRGGINLYAYVKNNPMSWVDPSGLCPEDKQKCIENFLQQNYGNFVANTLIPEFSAISLVTNFADFAKGSAISLGAKGALVGLPGLASKIATTTGNNLAAYPGMAGAAADALETGAFWGTTAATLGEAIAVGVTAVTAFSTAADAYARWVCRDVQ